MAGDLYVADDPRIREAVTQTSEAIHRYAELSRTDPAAARAVLVGLLGSLGEESHIRAPFVVDLDDNIHLGARTFAETFAHYLHILGSLWTAAASNVHLQPSTTPLIDYTDEPIERVLADWHEVSLLLNRFSRAMGQNDLYPFVLNAPTEVKLGFMHRIVTRITRRSATTS